MSNIHYLKHIEQCTLLLIHSSQELLRRVNDAYGDRNLICTCAPIEAYMEA